MTRLAGGALPRGRLSPNVFVPLPPAARFLSRERNRGKSAAADQLPGMDSERGVVKGIENGSRFVTDLKLCLPADDFRVSVSARLRRE